MKTSDLEKLPCSVVVRCCNSIRADNTICTTTVSPQACVILVGDEYRVGVEYVRDSNGDVVKTLPSAEAAAEWAAAAAADNTKEQLAWREKWAQREESK